MAFEVSISNRKWSDYIDLPVDETEQNRILKLIESVDDTLFKIGHCKEIPELNDAAFAENADFAELNFLAKRIDEVSKDKTQICAYRALMSELPDNICEAINRTYGLETVPVYPCQIFYILRANVSSSCSSISSLSSLFSIKFSKLSAALTSF